MITLAYFSSATAPFSPDALGALLARAQANNAALGVTGLLCHYDGSFLQFLEGPETTVDDLFARISADPRHHAVILMHRAPVDVRAFADWAMALVSPTEVSQAQRAFALGLREIEISAAAENRLELAGLLRAFRAWLR